MKKKKSIGWDAGSYFAEVYTDDDNGSGCGDNPMYGRWYGSLDECEALDMDEVELYPAEYSVQPDPFDLMCERRYDYHEVEDRT
jgi:hypothetical protein